MTKIIAIANHKGGVAKTTTAVNVAACLANDGYKTLLVDLDAQANATSCLLHEEVEDSIYRSLKDAAPLPIVKVKDNLSIVPSSLDLATIEIELSGRFSREFILKKILRSVSSEYDFILLDCPPSLGIITINALAAATDMYITLTAEALPSKGLAMLMDIAETAKEMNPELEISGIIITRWEKSKLSSMVEESLRETYGDIVFKTKIRKNIAVAEAPLYTRDVVSYSPTSNGAIDYIELTKEIESRLTE